MENSISGIIRLIIGDIMNKLKMVALFSTFLFALSGCSNDPEQSKTNPPVENKVDIYAFTKHYDKKKIPEFPLSKLQKETVNQIIDSFNLFVTEKSLKNFSTINSFAQKHDWSISIDDNASQYYHYVAKLNDGSDAYVLFEHYDFGTHENYYEVHVYNLNETQCRYVLNNFKYDQKIKVKVLEYTYGSDGTSSKDASCSDFGNKDKPYTSIELVHDGRFKTKEYIGFENDIVDLVNENYPKLTLVNRRRLYFTEKPVSYKTFYDNVDYVINPTNHHLIVGALNKEECKKIVYNLPENLQYTVNEGKQCEDTLNKIEFFKKQLQQG
jgi:hypothetical protein